jgi:hypothetical protein
MSLDYLIEVQREEEKGKTDRKIIRIGDNLLIMYSYQALKDYNKLRKTQTYIEDMEKHIKLCDDPRLTDDPPKSIDDEERLKAVWEEIGAGHSWEEEHEQKILSGMCSERGADGERLLIFNPRLPNGYYLPEEIVLC